MGWLFKSDWAANPRNPANADLDNIALDIKTWGANVDASGWSLVNCAGIFGAASKLGVGTGTPQYTLHVVGVGSAPQLAIGVDFNTLYNLQFTYTNPNGVIQSYAGGVGSFLLLNPAGGYVGVGAVTPTVAFQAYGVVGPPASSGNINTGIAVSQGNVGPSLNMGVYSSAGLYYAWIQSAFANNANVVQPLVFQQIGGNVGIGATAPQALLQLGAHLGTVPACDMFIGGHAGGGTEVCRIRTGSYDNNGGYGFFLKTHYTSASVVTFGTRDGATDIPTLYLKGGKVGIGAAAPPHALVVVSGTDCVVNFRADPATFGGTAGIVLQSVSSDQASFKPLNFCAASHFFYGNVGMGVAAPNAALHVAGSFIQPIPTTQSVADGSIANSQMFCWYDEAGNRIVFRVKSSAGVLKTGYAAVS